MTVTADLIRMSGTMARSSKTSSSLSPNGRTDSSANCSTSYFTGSLFPPDPSFINIFFHSRRRRDEEVTCYGDLGCFRDEVRLLLFASLSPPVQTSSQIFQGPFNYLDMLPSPPEEIGTVFLLYTQQNRELHQVRNKCKTPLMG